MNTTSITILILLVTLASCNSFETTKKMTSPKLSAPFLEFAHQQKFKTIDFKDVKVKSGYQNDRPTFDESHNIYWTLWESKKSPATDPVIVWITGGPGVTPGGMLFAFGGPFHVNWKTGYWTENNWGFNQFANILIVTYPYGTAESGVNHKKWMNIKPENMPGNFVRFLSRWMENHKEYSKNDLYLSGDSATGALFPIFYHHALTLKAKPKWLPQVKGFLFDGPIWTERGMDSQALLESQIFHLNSKKTEKKFAENISILNAASNTVGSLQAWRNINDGLMKMHRYAPRRRCYFDLRQFSVRNRKRYAAPMHNSCGLWIYARLKILTEIYNSEKFKHYEGQKTMGPYTGGFNPVVLLAGYAWLGKRDSHKAYESVLKSGLKIAWTTGEYDSTGLVYDFLNICKKALGKKIGKEIEDKKWELKGNGTYKNWNNIHIFKANNAGHLVWLKRKREGYHFFKKVVETPAESSQQNGQGLDVNETDLE